MSVRKRLRAIWCQFISNPLYRSVVPSGGQNVLKRVKRMIIPPSVKTFFFKLHSSTLPVKVWLQAKGIDVPWSVDCILCKKPETIEHVFIFCWDAVFFWDVLQRTLKKQLCITQSGIRFLNVSNDDEVPYNMFMLLGLCSIWRSRMAVRHADSNAKEVRFYFFNLVKQVESVCKPGYQTRVAQLLQTAQ